MRQSARNTRRGKRIDWPAAKTEYVNNVALTYAGIARKYGGNESSIRRRAAREAWGEERASRVAILQQKVTKESIRDIVAELAKYNEQDLIAAKALRSLDALKMQGENLETKDIRALAGAVESAPRIARLALGASTQNTDTHSTIVSEIERMTLEERRERIRRLHPWIRPLASG